MNVLANDQLRRLREITRIMEKEIKNNKEERIKIMEDLEYKFATLHNMDTHKGRKYYKKLMLGLKMTYYDGNFWCYGSVSSGCT